MKLLDIAAVSAQALNDKMQAKLGWNIQLEKMTVSEASDMISSIDGKLNAVRRSKRLHESQNDKAYTSMLLARKVLESFIAEKKAVSRSQQQAAGAALAAKRGDAPKAGLKGASKEMMDMSKKELEKIAGTKHKGLPKHVDEAEVSEAGLKGSKDMTADFVKAIEKKTKGKETATRDKKGVLQLKKKNVNESVLSEDEVSQAESMMAAKDMVDSIQGMLEDVSRMLNEQLPPLTDNIRANIGAAQADSFQGSASGTLNTLLSAVQQARTSMDSTVRSLTGEPAPVSVPAAPDAEADMDLGADEFSASDAAAGGELPMGREKRT